MDELKVKAKKGSLTEEQLALVTKSQAAKILQEGAKKGKRIVVLRNCPLCPPYKARMNTRAWRKHLSLVHRVHWTKVDRAVEEYRMKGLLQN